MWFLELIIYIKVRSTSKLLQYCLTHVPFDFVGDAVVTHATSFENSSCIAESIVATGKWSFFVTLLHEGYLYVMCHWLKNWRPFVCEIFDILKSLLLKRTLTIAHECGAEIASQEWYIQGSSFKKEVCGTFQLDLNVISNNVEISSQQFFKCVFSNACCFNCLSTKNRHNFTRA